ncbi:LysR substrate-binding domain-containing protein [Motiliproteus sp. MSK22-1]|uniref:LysR substrate-binding domain-containing protein n=1 Tax=Motiliproteus sp. MSK22-1 TaxID=1897630 RepID=UPI000975FE92|nr:LysR substrate-binding domain-containing protein [Motiliproteus sp. MSK22-1]OMH38057.1 hypothetical protein BGP75_07175 [Motiliproteus sp. MSK22-1]
MKRNLPPLNALKAFEAAARCLSFSRAAQELCVTQGAISKQVQQLEHYLDQILFERLSSGIRLTAAGERYFPVISQSLDSIQSATSLLKQTSKHESVVSLEVTPSFSSLWLIPRLKEFTAKHPDIHLEISTGDGHVHSKDIHGDIAVRCLPLGSYADSHLLLAERLWLVASPQQQIEQPLMGIEELGRQTLLPHLTRPQLWQTLLTGQLATRVPPSLTFGTGFEHFYMTMEAILQGAGIGLVPGFMVRPKVEKGALVNLLNIRFDSGYGYYMIVPAYKATMKKNDRVRRWLLEQFNEERIV